MKILMKSSRIVSFMLVLSMGLSGCVIVPKGLRGGNRLHANATPAERELHELSKAMRKTVVEAVAIGAGIGLAASLLTNRDGQQTLENVLAGAVVGGLAGSYVAHLQSKYATEEARVNAAITDLQTTNSDARATLTVMRRVVSDQRNELARLRQAVANGTAEQSALNQETREAQANLRDMRDAEKGTRKRLTEFQRAVAQNPSSSADRELAELSNRISEMREVSETLAEDI